MSLEYLVSVHSHKKEKVKHYSRQITYSLALICLVFFGTILSYHATSTNMNRITGLMTYATTSTTAADVNSGFDIFTDFVTAVRTSPQVTEIKLFFYTLWILVVLVGSALYYEFEKRN
jgi:uncharacterized membrane protein